MYSNTSTYPYLLGLDNLSTVEMLTTEPINYTRRCEFYKKMLTFDTVQLIRVIITWILFLLSFCGNIFILHCIFKMKKINHYNTLALHLTLADLAFTLFVIPIDGTWNITMEWLGGDFLCRAAQMMKQFGMYISSLMVVVISLDRCCSLLIPMSAPHVQAKRTKIFLATAWTISLLSSIPAAVLFTVVKKMFCPEKPLFTQCVDFKLVTQKDGLKIYHIFTMLMSFVLPFLIASISYILVIFEIQNMQSRDQKRMGRRVSSSDKMETARRKTMLLTSLVTLSFVLLWGPYYGIGIITWFDSAKAIQVPREISMWLFLLMYLHPTVHPFIYGVFIESVRKRFVLYLRNIYNCFRFRKISNDTNIATSKRCYPCLSKVDEYPFVAMKKKSTSQQSTGTALNTPRTSRSGLTDHNVISATYECSDVNKNNRGCKEDAVKTYLDLPNEQVGRSRE